MAHLLSKYRLLHHHIPRTGGTWIDRALRILDVRVSMRFRFDGITLPMKHCLLSHYTEDHRSRWDTTFTFVRHPIKYYESVWSYLYTIERYRSGLKRFDWHPFMDAYLCWDYDFNVWAGTMLRKYPGWVSHLFEMYVGPKGGEFCNYIGRTESIVENFCEIMADFGLSDDKIFDLEKQNMSKVEVEWDESLKLAVNRSEHSSISRFYGNNFNKLRYLKSSIERKEVQVAITTSRG